LQKRLEQGQATLRERLERHDLTLGTLSVTNMLGSTNGCPTIPARLIESTARAAVVFRSGTLTSGAAEAARTVLRSLAIKGIVQTSGWLALACLFVIGGGVAIWKITISNSEETNKSITPVARVARPTDSRRPQPATSRRSRVDVFGDPLPDGAVARIGSVRF